MAKSKTSSRKTKPKKSDGLSKLKEFLDQQIKFLRKQKLLHISKRENYNSIPKIEGMIAAHQITRQKFFGRKLA